MRLRGIWLLAYEKSLIFDSHTLLHRLQLLTPLFSAKLQAMWPQRSTQVLSHIWLCHKLRDLSGMFRVIQLLGLILGLPTIRVPALENSKLIYNLITTDISTCPFYWHGLHCRENLPKVHTLLCVSFIWLFM